ncbi:MAG TPA: hypothetical protein H9823_05310 [Candidatus Rubneribacter avistercoris]|nr:hypothetical protein [Candidatus Rubneribacter avistercoris]
MAQYISFSMFYGKGDNVLSLSRLVDVVVVLHGGDRLAAGIVGGKRPGLLGDAFRLSRSRSFRPAPALLLNQR